MGRVWVHGASVEGDRLVRLSVRLGALPSRTIDRDTAIRWLRDGHSFVTTADGSTAGVALQLVLVGDADEAFVRTDVEPIAADALPKLPAA